MRKPKVFIIDDDRDWLQLYIDQLNDTGEIEAAGSLSYDQKLLDEFRPDIILLDILLGERNGLDILREIRAKIVSQKAILISCSEEEVIKARGLQFIALIKGFGLGPSSPMGLSKCIRTMCSEN